MDGRRWMLLSAGVGLVGLALTVVGGVVLGPSVALRAYLLGYMFWLGLGLGALGILVIQYLTGGMWGLAMRRLCEAGAATLLLMAPLFIPILLGMPLLYEWAQPDAVAADPVLQGKAVYLNPTFFAVRSVVYFVVWIALSVGLRRVSALRRLQRLSIVGAIALGLTVTFAAIDWLMSLDAQWFSTMYPPMIGMNDLLLAFAFAIVAIVQLAPETPLRDVVTPDLYNDLGSLLLAFVMLWAYLAFFQYLLIWAGNLSDEIPWYVQRSQGGWQPVAIALAVLGFGVPFVLLLFRPLKRNPRTLAAIAAFVCLTRLLDMYWLVVPAFSPGGPSLTWVDLTAIIGVGGLWLAVFAWQLESRPLLAAQDPRLVEVMEAASAGA